MNETLLQFIWQHSLYLPGKLETTAGEAITIIYSGKLNRDAGPDFLEAKIKIDSTMLVGNIELHVNSSDWLKHGHQHDAAYKNLILHVVYNNDADDVAEHMPVLTLSEHIPAHIIAQYMNLVQAPQQLPCTGKHAQVKDITKEGWLNRMLAERWEHKLAEWDALLKQSAHDWRNLLYWRMAANFGFKVNGVPFLMLAQSIPLNILARHREDLFQIEALLFGQAGMLNSIFKDEYPLQLQKEYAYLKQKYGLTAVREHLWKFLRMRPANFPTIRIAQFAALVNRSVHLFSQIIETDTIAEITPLLDVAASAYWETHYLFDEPADRKTIKKFGASSIHNVIINTIAPIRFLYAGKQGEPIHQEKALQLLDTVPAEKNNILNIWNDNGWEAKSATQSQALLQLYNNYCSSKRCLKCAIGLNVIRALPIER